MHLKANQETLNFKNLSNRTPPPPPPNIQKLMIFYSDYFTEVNNKGTGAVIGKRLLPVKPSNFVKLLEHIFYRTPPDDF